jgi:hypothetical protein
MLGYWHWFASRFLKLEGRFSRTMEESGGESPVAGQLILLEIQEWDNE